MGVCNPIDKQYVTGNSTHWIWKMTLVKYISSIKGWKHFVTRTILFSIVHAGVYYGITMLILFGMCRSGNVFIEGLDVNGVSMGNKDPQCWWKPTAFIWIKSTWAGK